jgi:hypothetical protein
MMALRPPLTIYREEKAMRQASTVVIAAILAGCTTTDSPMYHAATVGGAFTGAASAAESTFQAAGAASGGGATSTSPGRFSAGGAIGFTIDPSAFLTTFEADYAVTDNVLVGPLLQVAVSDEQEIVAPSLNAQYLIDLAEGSDPLAKLKPFAQVGLGCAYIEKERKGRTDKDDLGFLLNVGFGLRYYVTNHFAVGNSVLFNAMPDEVIDERFFFSWQFLSGTIRF